MKMKSLLRSALICLLGITALTLCLFGFRRYVNHCYVASWLGRCQPYMTLDEVFSVLPDRFSSDCPLNPVGSVMPHVCFLPSDCSKLDIEYVVRLRSDIDKLSLFSESCVLYFDKNERLVVIEYLPYHFSIDNKAWGQFVVCRKPYQTTACGLASRTVVVASRNEVRVYAPVEDWYQKKGGR